jgi:hypothetical protein
MERSFAHSVRFGFKRARWRRLWRVQIQEYLTAAIQNIAVLIRNAKEPRTAVSAAIRRAKDVYLNLLEDLIAIATMQNCFPGIFPFSDW